MILLWRGGGGELGVGRWGERELRASGCGGLELGWVRVGWLGRGKIIMKDGVRRMVVIIDLISDAQESEKQYLFDWLVPESLVRAVAPEERRLLLP